MALQYNKDLYLCVAVVAMVVITSVAFFIGWFNLDGCSSFCCCFLDVAHSAPFVVALAAVAAVAASAVALWPKQDLRFSK